MPEGKVLLIEDNNTTFSVIRRLLKNVGYPEDSVIRCTDLKALHRVNTKGVEIVLTDLSLPDSSYNSTFAHVQQLFPYTPVIVLTGTSEIEVAIKTIQQGAQDYLIKGEFDEKILRKAIQYAIERKKISNDYKRLFEENPTPMYIYDNDSYRFLEVNKAALNQYGYTREQFLEMTAENIRPAEDLERFYEVNKNIPDEYYDAGRWRHINSEGVTFFVHIYAHSSEFEGKKAHVILAVNIDKQVKAEKELLEKGSEIENILESITDGFYTLDSEWRFTYVNKESEKRLRSSREELLGKSIWENFPETKQTKFYSEYHKAVKERVSVHFEEYYAPLDIWISVNAYPTKDVLAVYFVDITEQKKIQDQIFNDAQKLRAIINNTQDIIWSVDRNYNLIDANQAYWERLASMTGKKGYEVKSEDFADDILETWYGYYERVFDGETFKLVMTKKHNGKEIYEEVSFNPVHDKAGSIMAVSCFARDITDQRQYLNMIQQQNEKLRKIAWIQSHEVRSPVAHILGLVQLFNSADATDPVNNEVLEKIKEAAHNLDDAIKKTASYTSSPATGRD